jgi:hypothetical protein
MIARCPQGTLRRVAAEVEVQVRELMALLKERVMAQAHDAVECIGLIRRLGGPVADLQVHKCTSCLRTVHLNASWLEPGRSAITTSQQHRMHAGAQPVPTYMMESALQDEFLRAMKASLRTSLTAASAALEDTTVAGCSVTEAAGNDSGQAVS